MDLKEALLFALGLLLAAAVLTAPVACTMNRQQIVAKAIKDGGDPISIKCAIEGDTNSPMCLVKAAQK